MKRFLGVLSLILAASAFDAAGTAQAQDADQAVIVVLRGDGAAFEAYRNTYRETDEMRADPDGWSYLDRGVVGAVQALERAHGFRAAHAYSAAVRGFAARLTSGQIQALRRSPLVQSIEADRPMYAVAQTLPWGIDRVDADVSSVAAGDGTGTVSGVRLFVIDTGSEATHPDLRVIHHVNFTGAGGGGNADCNGHGTHTAGTAAARDNTTHVVGVAPGTAIIGVKVLNCSGSGSTSGVIKGVDWTTAAAASIGGPAVANMSLGGPASAALDNAVRNSAASGVVYAVAAGNNGVNACTQSPARAGTTDGIITVAATDINENEAVFSNYGPCVDVWAPGVGVLSTFLGGGTATGDGTSMSSPHVAGGAVLYLRMNPAATPADVEAAIKATTQAPGTLSKDGRLIERLWVGSF